MSLSTSKIQLAPLGIDMLSDVSALTPGTVRDAVNVNIKDVTVSRRAGFRRASSFTGGHSLWGTEDQAFGLFVRNRALRMLRVQSQQLLSRELLQLGSDERMSYFEAATGEVYATNGVDLVCVRGETAVPVGLPDPAGELPFTTMAGSLPAGKYAVAYSTTKNGYESALSPTAKFELTEPGGLRTTLQAQGDTVRVYLTQTNGDVLYLQAEYPAGLTTYELTALKPAQVAGTQFLTRMPAGSIVRMFNGRLLVARGATLIFSEPMNPGLTSLRHNFVQLGETILMVEPVVGGVYVGTGEGVFFLRGTGPGDFRLLRVSANIPAPHASCRVPASFLPEKKRPDSAGRVALWMGVAGYSAGLDGGEVIELQSELVRLPSAGETTTTPYMQNGNRLVVSVVESVDSTGFGSAVDG